MTPRAAKRLGDASTVLALVLPVMHFAWALSKPNGWTIFPPMRLPSQAWMIPSQSWMQISSEPLFWVSLALWVLSLVCAIWLRRRWWLLILWLPAMAVCYAPVLIFTACTRGVCL